MRKQPQALDLAADIEIWKFNLPRHLTMMEPSTRQTSKNVLPPQLHLRAFYSAVSYIAESRGTSGQARNLSHNPQQASLHDLTASLLQIERHFGAQSMPASVSVLVPFILTRSSSMSINQYTPNPDTEHVIESYKALWGWGHKPRHQGEHLTGATLVDRSQNDDQLPPSLTSQDPLLAAMHCEIARGLSATLISEGLSQTDEQALDLNMVASGESNAAGLDPNLMTLDDFTASGTDSMLADTPTQLLDYLALLQQNER